MQRGSGYQTMLCRGSEKAEFQNHSTAFGKSTSQRIYHEQCTMFNPKKKNVFMRTLLITFQKTTVSGGKLVHSGLGLRNKLTLLLVAVSGKNVL